MTVNRVVRLMTVYVALVLSLVGSAHALDVKFQPVANGVYAYIGDTGSAHHRERRPQRQHRSRRDAGRRRADRQRRHLPVSDARSTTRSGKSLRYRSSGSSTPAGRTIAGWAMAISGNRAPKSSRTRMRKADMQARGGDHLSALKIHAERRSRRHRTHAAHALHQRRHVRAWTWAASHFSSKHRNGAHTPGDMMVWLPQQHVLFTGDVVYVNRLLGVIPVSHTRNWLGDASRSSRRSHPQVIVPGHGDVYGSADRPGADTQAYLHGPAHAHEEGGRRRHRTSSTAVKSFDAQPWHAPAERGRAARRATRAAPTSNSSANDVCFRTAFPSFPLGATAWTSKYSEPAARTAAPPSR